MPTDKDTPANLALQNSAFAANSNDCWMAPQQDIVLLVPLLSLNFVVGLLQTLIGGIIEVASLWPAKNVTGWKSDFEAAKALLLSGGNRMALGGVTSTPR